MRKTVELDDGPRHHETASGVFRGLRPLVHVKISCRVDAVGPKRIVGEGESLTLTVETCGANEAWQEKQDE